MFLACFVEVKRSGGPMTRQVIASDRGELWVHWQTHAELMVGLRDRG